MFRCALVLLLAGCSQMAAPPDAPTTMGAITWDLNDPLAMVDPPARSLAATCAGGPVAFGLTPVNWETGGVPAAQPSAFGVVYLDAAGTIHPRMGRLFINEDLMLTPGAVAVDETGWGARCEITGAATRGNTATIDATITCSIYEWQQPIRIQLYGCEL